MLEPSGDYEKWNLAIFNAGILFAHGFLLPGTAMPKSVYWILLKLNTLMADIERKGSAQEL